MSNEGFVELESGETVMLSDCLKRVSLMTFLTRTHIDVCDALSKRILLDEEQRQVFVNLLRAHSEPAREITAAVSLINSGKLVARRLICVADPIALSTVVSADVEIHPISGQASGLLDSKQLLRFLIKAIVHKLYRLWPRLTKETNTAVRAWVELSEAIYPDVHQDGTVLIYPFYLNFARHIRYIRRCRQRYPNVQLIGLPYGVFRFLWDLISGQDRDVALVTAEVRAFSKHADEIWCYARKTLFCNDEFEAGVVCLANRLKRRNVGVINTSHGLSFGSPYVGYDEFVVYNKAQIHYYHHRSPGTKFRVQIRRNAAVEEAVSLSTEFHPVVLLMHGNFTRADLRYERRLELDIVRQLKRICREISIEFLVKLHPNAIREDIDIFEKIEEVKTIRRLDDLSGVNPFFVATITTAFYDFFSDGPFLFVNDGIVSIEDIYGFPYPSVDMAGLEEDIKARLAYGAYKSSLKAQIDSLEGHGLCRG